MNRQRGNAILYGIIVLFIIALAGGVVFTYTHAIERAQKAETDRDVWKVNAETQAAANADLKEDIAEKDKLLAARQAKRNAADEIGRKVDDALERAKNSKEVRDWADTPVPQSVAASLRGVARAPGSGVQDGEVPAGAKPAAALPGR